MPLSTPRVTGGQQGLIAQRDIGGGLNERSSPYVIPANQFKALLNAYLVEDGSLLGRRGTARWNAVSLGAGAVLGAFRYYATGNNHWLVAHGGTVYRGDDGLRTFTASLAGLSSGARCWFVQYLATAYLANQTDAPRKYDGAAWSAMGIAAPGAAATAAAGGAGALTGTYTVKVTFVTAALESNGSPASNAVTVAAQQIALTGIPTGPAGTLRRRIYGFKSAVSSVYQLIGEIADNATTTFTVTADQNAWTTAIPTTNDPPGAAPWLYTVFKNRIWAASGRRVSFSQIFVPEAWPPTFYVDLPLDQNDEVTALFVLGDLLLCFTHNSIYYVVGDTPFSFIVRKSFASAGCPSPWAVARVEQSAVFLSRFGVLAFDGQTTRVLSDAVEPTFTGLVPGKQSINYAAADGATLRWYDRLKAVVTSFPTGASVANDVTLWLFARRQAWARDGRAARLLLTTDGRGDAGDLFALDPADGILRQWDVTYTDDGAPITLRWKTGALSGAEHPLAEKAWRWFTLRGKVAPATAQIVASVDEGAESESFAMSLARGAVYGAGTYGTSTYAADFDDFEEALGPAMKGRTITIEGAIAYTDRIHLAQMFLGYLPPGAVRRRVG